MGTIDPPINSYEVVRDGDAWRAEVTREDRVMPDDDLRAIADRLAEALYRAVPAIGSAHSEFCISSDDCRCNVDSFDAHDALKSYERLRFTEEQRAPLDDPETYWKADELGPDLIRTTPWPDDAPLPAAP